MSELISLNVATFDRISVQAGAAGADDSERAQAFQDKIDAYKREKSKASVPKEEFKDMHWKVRAYAYTFKSTLYMACLLMTISRELNC